MPAERASRNRRSRMRSCSLGLQDVAEIDGLDGHRTADIRVDRVVHHAHCASSQFPDDLVSPDAIHPVLVITQQEMRRVARLVSMDRSLAVTAP